MLIWLESHLQGPQYNGVGRALDVGQKNSEIYFTKAGSPEFTPIHSIFKILTILQSKIFTSRSQNLLSPKLQSSSFWNWAKIAKKGWKIFDIFLGPHIW